MPTYLLDNNVISVAVRPSDSRHQSVIENLKAASSEHVVLSTVAIAEIHEGMARVDGSGIPLPAAAATQRQQLREFLFNYPKRFSFDTNAIESYSLIRARLWLDHGNKQGRKWIEKVLEELTERSTGKSLGFDERDLMIACTAMAYNLTLATLDFNSGMNAITGTAKTLSEEGKPIVPRVEDWTTYPPRRVF